jgi:hypothetical protein
MAMAIKIKEKHLRIGDFLSASQIPNNCPPPSISRKGAKVSCDFMDLASQAGNVRSRLSTNVNALEAVRGDGLNGLNGAQRLNAWNGCLTA